MTSNMELLWGGGEEMDCKGKHCPSIYRSADGSIVIQGYELSVPEQDDLTIPAGEGAVRVPSQLIEAIKKLL